jgi:hypothetical protein
MPVTNCPQHGESVGMEGICHHSHQAYLAESVESVVLLADLWCCWLLCASCAAIAEKVPPEMRAEAKDWPLPRDEWCLECCECLAVWFARTGQGDLLEACRQLREREGWNWD